MSSNESFTVRIEKMVPGGDCLCRINGKNVFVPGAIPGECADIEIVSSHGDYDRARIVQVREPSPHRTEPFCPFYGICGGCTMQHIDASEQRKLRAQMLEESFERAGIRCPEIEVVFGRETAYRGRIQLTDGGFNEKESNRIVPIDTCPVATDEINRWLSKTPPAGRPSGRVPVFGDPRVLNAPGKCIVAAQDAHGRNGAPLIQGGAGSGRNGKLRLRKNTRFSGTVPSDRNRCEVSILGKKVAFDVRGFFQSNLAVLEKMIAELCRDIGGTSLLDMYAGCGTFSVFLSDFFDRTVLVEHNRDAVVFAEENLAGTPHESYGVSGSKWTELHSGSPFDAVVIDPPRSGMEKDVRRWLCSARIPQVRSVSCNPSTHARDIADLLRAGYILEKVYLLDFYPNTAHIESLAVLHI